MALVREGHNFFDAWSEEAKCFIHGRGPGFFIPGAPGQGGFSRPLVRGAFFILHPCLARSAFPGKFWDFPIILNDFTMTKYGHEVRRPT